MNYTLRTMALAGGALAAHLQRYGRSVLATRERLATAVQAWTDGLAGPQGPMLIATASVAAAALLTLAYVIFLFFRARRETRRLREEYAKLVALTEAAESANEKKAKFIASMGHRIRTPMNAIVGFTDLALKTDLDPDMREHLDTVRTSADWLMHIANDVLEFSRTEAEKLRLDNVPFSISECIRSAMKIVECEAAARGIVTSSTIDPQLPNTVCGDPIQLRHVIFNLLDYTVRFTRSGRVVLSAALESDSGSDVFVRITVSDTSSGIPPAKRPVTFRVAQNTSAEAAVKSDSASLGLVISRELVRLMGGKLESDSQLGEPSTFEFTVRLQKSETEAEVEAPVCPPESVGGKELSILVAEDNVMNLRLITKVLQSAGHRVWTAANGKEAAHNFQTEGFDLILMDLEMPDMNGIEATRAIRAAEPQGLHVPIYAVTAHALPADRDRCLGAGMDGFITKPITAHEVLKLVSKVAAGECNVSAADHAIDSGDKGPVAELTDWQLPVEYVKPTLNGGVGTSIGVENIDGDAGENARVEGPAASIWRSHIPDIGEEPKDNAVTSEHVEQVVPDTSEIVERGLERSESHADSGEHEVEVEPTASYTEDVTVAIAVESFSSEADSTYATDSLTGEEEGDLISSPYLLASVLEPETPGLSGPAMPAVNPTIDEDCDVAPITPGILVVADSLSHAVEHVTRSEEIISVHAHAEAPRGNSDGCVLAANPQVGAPAGLALLEAAFRVTEQSTPPLKPKDGFPSAAVSDPFEQARKSLSESRFAVRVIHNDGDPSDRNLI